MGASNYGWHRPECHRTPGHIDARHALQVPFRDIRNDA